MDRQKYLPENYSKEDKKLISLFQNEAKKIKTLYFSALSNKNSSKANSLLSQLKNINKELNSYYNDWVDKRIPKEYYKGALYMDDVVNDTNSLEFLETATTNEVFKKIKTDL